MTIITFANKYSTLGPEKGPQPLFLDINMNNWGSVMASYDCYLRHFLRLKTTVTIIATDNLERAQRDG